MKFANQSCGIDVPLRSFGDGRRGRRGRNILRDGRRVVLDAVGPVAIRRGGSLRAAGGGLLGDMRAGSSTGSGSADGWPGASAGRPVRRRSQQAPGVVSSLSSAAPWQARVPPPRIRQNRGSSS